MSDQQGEEEPKKKKKKSNPMVRRFMGSPVE